MDNNTNLTKENISDSISDDDSFVLIASDDESIILNETRIKTYDEIVKDIQAYKHDKVTNKIILIFSCHNVRLYKNKSNGIVTLLNENSTLSILQFKETNTSSSIFCLHLISHEDSEDWIYPLDKKKLQCFYTNYGAFIFPELIHLQDPSNPFDITYGLVIEPPGNEIVLEILEGILLGLIKEIPSRTYEVSTNISEVVSKNIVNGSTYISSTMIVVAEKTGDLIGRGATLLKSKLQPSMQQTVISERVKYGIDITKTITSAGVTVTGTCASAVGSATMALGRFFAPHIQNKLPILLTSGFGIKPETTEASLNNIFTITSGAFEGVSTIYAGLEQSAAILGEKLASNVVTVVEHKYGENAGNVAKTTFDTAGNVINISQNVNFMTPKGLVKKSVKATGIALVKEYKPSTSANEPNEGLYPDISGLIKELDNDNKTQKPKE